MIAAVAMSATSALAQVEQPSQISIQGTALVTKSSNDQIPSNDATKSGGLLVGYSYQFNRWFGAEGNYGYTRNTQNFITLGGRVIVASRLSRSDWRAGRAHSGQRAQRSALRAGWRRRLSLRSD